MMSSSSNSSKEFFIDRRKLAKKAFKRAPNHLAGFLRLRSHFPAVSSTWGSSSSTTSWRWFFFQFLGSLLLEIFPTLGIVPIHHSSLKLFLSSFLDCFWFNHFFCWDLRVLLWAGVSSTLSLAVSSLSSFFTVSSLTFLTNQVFSRASLQYLRFLALSFFRIDGQ